MSDFDVAIVGAGPAGGQCARILSKEGWKVLLVEQHETFLANNFSSGACPLEVLETYDLSEQAIGSYWHNIEINTTNICRRWESSNSLGVVFDFAKLREFLATQAKVNGCEVWMGCRYLKSYQESDCTVVNLKFRDRSEPISVRTKILVDATGYARSVIYTSKKERPNFLKIAGTEYLLKVDEETYQKYAKTLTFLFGHYWSPKGYSWIFPMDNCQLKTGTVIYDEPHKLLPKINPLKDYTKNIIKTHIKPKSYEVLDVHGSVVEYSKELCDRYYQNNTLAIGDAVSTINYLGAEGIRHAFRGSEIACRHISACLRRDITSFEPYQQEMQATFRKDWNRCETIRRKVYLEYSDRKIDLGVAYLKYLTLEDLIDVLFHYKFEKFMNGSRRYLALKLKFFLDKIYSKFVPKKLDKQCRLG
ncbi:MAG: NAD(P)/FAD-dependent oxidoreductase [Hydrococcus sp. CRU_1_1]|nr:NAD(P)/FAD-dependent oxidoreductase [Hydrococcus sp. CRU_1_1]